MGSTPSKYRRLPKFRNVLLYSNAFDASVIERQMYYIRPLVSGKKKAARVIPHI